MNETQIEYWNGPRGHSWVADQELRDHSLAPFGDACMRLAKHSPGERVVDVGCGCGASVLALASAVGAGGHVLGVDVSAPMLERARRRTAPLANVSLLRADAAGHAFDGRAQLVHSRFGVMFFEDPPAAFANLRRALAPGGRLAFICWRGLDENRWMSVPAEAVRRALPSLPPAVLGGPGPLSLADPDLLRTLLEGAGFREVVLQPFDHSMPLGNGQGLEAAATEAMTLGPAARLLANVEEPDRARALSAIREALAPHVRGSDVALAGATWLASARG